MDNNYYNNMNENNTNQNNMNQNNTTGTPTGSAYGTNSGSAYGTNTSQGNAYGTNTNQGSAYGTAYNPYNGQQNAYNPYQQPNGMGKKPKKVKKSGGFGKTLGKCAAIAVIFGLVAGGTFTGTSYIGTKALGIESSAKAGNDSPESSAKKSDSNSGKSVQQTSTGSATDLSDVSAIAKEAMPSIVAITNTGKVSYQTMWGIQEKDSESCGSGIIIKQDDKYLYIATNNHVVADAESLTVQFCNDKTVSCEVKGTDSADDLAVVKVALKSIDSDTLSAIKVATISEDSDSLEVGQGVIAIGNALGYGQSVTNGIISALGRTVTVQDEQTGETIVNNNMIQTNAAINPGNSGGALLNAQGEVIGINSAKYSDTSVEGFGYAIPMSDAMPIIEQLITKEKVDQAQSAFLGIQGQDISSDIASAYNMPEGVYVYQVVEGSAAEKAGIRQGDIITAIDGKSVTSMSQLKENLAYYKAGDKGKVTFQRLGDGYKEKTVEVTFDAQSGN